MTDVANLAAIAEPSSDAIREAARRARGLLDASPDPLVATDLEGRITDLNRAMEEATGVAHSSLLGTELAECFAAPDAARTAWRRALAEDGVRDYPLALRHASGGIAVVLCTVRVYRDAAGRIAGVLAAVHDVTERKRSEEARLRSERHLAGILDVQATMLRRIEAIGDWIWEVDENGITTYSSPRMRELLGIAPEDVVGRRVGTRLSDADAATIVPLVERVLAERKAFTMAETVHHRADGREVMMETSGTPILDAHGEFRGFRAVTRDITARRLAEIALSRNVADLDETRRVANVGGWTFERDTGSVAWSEQIYRMFGRDPATPPPRFADQAEILAPESLARLAGAMAAISANGMPFECDLQLIRADGSTGWIATRGEAVRNAAGAITGARGTAFDISARKRADETREAGLRRAQAQAEALVAIAASGALLAGNVEQLAREVTEVAARVTGVERASVWLLDTTGAELRCVDLYQASAARHSVVQALIAQAFSSQFEILKAARFIAADDPLADPRTAGFVETRVKPSRITALLDAVVELSGRHLGVVCLEHVDRAHHWEADEIAFACSLADKVALSIANRAGHLAQEKLAESELRFRSVAEAAQDALVTIDGAGAVRYWNPAAARMLGYAADEACRRNIHDLLAPARYRDVAARGVARFRETGRGPMVGRTVELVAVRKDGTEIPVELSLAAMRAGHEWTAIGIIRDISVRRLADAALRASHDMLAATERMAGIGGFEWDLVENVAVWSAEAYRVFGQTPTTFTPSLDSIIACLHPDDRPRLRDAVAAALEREVPFDVECRIARPDGSEAIIRSRAEVFRDAAGKAIRMAGTIRDVTERKRAEDGRRIAAAIVDASPTVLFRWQPTGGPTTTTAAIVYASSNVSLFGYDAGDLMARRAPYGPMVHPDDLARVMREVDEHLASGATRFDQDYRLLTKSGESRWVEDHTSVDRDAAGRVVQLQGTILDITERKRSEEKLRISNRALHALSRSNKALIGATDEASLLDQMCRIIVEVGGYRMAWIGIAETDPGQSVRPAAVAGHDDGFTAAARKSWADVDRGQSTMGIAIRTGAVQVNRDLASDPRTAPWRAAALERGYAAVVALPLRDRARVLGALAIYSSDRGAFDAEELALLVELADDLSYGINALRDRAGREQALLRWQNSLEATVGAVSSTVEARDPYTAGHQQRTARLAAAIARELGLTPDAVRGLFLAALIHDVGKIQVPAEILSKPGKLSKPELELVKTHAQAGYDIVKGVDFPWPIAQMILQHHERLDGSGYPNGLKGDAILIEAKILAVADVVEAMMSFRPYRVALGIDVALAEIEQGKGRLYDPAAVEACLKLFRGGGFTFDEKSRDRP